MALRTYSMLAARRAALRSTGSDLFDDCGDEHEGADGCAACGQTAFDCYRLYSGDEVFPGFPAAGPLGVSLRDDLALFQAYVAMIWRWTALRAQCESLLDYALSVDAVPPRGSRQWAEGLSAVAEGLAYEEVVCMWALVASGFPVVFLDPEPGKGAFRHVPTHRIAGAGDGLAQAGERGLRGRRPPAPAGDAAANNR